MADGRVNNESVSPQPNPIAFNTSFLEQHQPVKSPPPLTKIVKKKPSSPREFFERLYGPDKEEKFEEKEMTHTAMRETEGTLATSLQIPSLGLSSYSPSISFPTSPDHLMTIENLPFPAGLAAFCKLFIH